MGTIIPLSTSRAIVVRDAVTDDALAVARIGSAGFSGSYKAVLAEPVIEAVSDQTYTPPSISACIRRCIAAADAEFLVATRGEDVVGFLHFDSEGAEPELHRIYVDPTQTGAGIGAALLGELHRRLVATDYTLMVLAANRGAIRFYERHGLIIERETDAVAHYEENMGFVPPETTPVPAFIMRYRPIRQADG